MCDLDSFVVACNNIKPRIATGEALTLIYRSSVIREVRDESDLGRDDMTHELR